MDVHPPLDPPGNSYLRAVPGTGGPIPLIYSTTTRPSFTRPPSAPPPRRDDPLFDSRPPQVVQQPVPAQTYPDRAISAREDIPTTRSKSFAAERAPAPEPNADALSDPPSGALLFFRWIDQLTEIQTI